MVYVGLHKGSNPYFYKVRPVLLHVYKDRVFLLPIVEYETRVALGNNEKLSKFIYSKKWQMIHKKCKAYIRTDMYNKLQWKDLLYFKEN